MDRQHISTMKKISILVPCCNVEQYVRQCLDSIKNQTHKNIEVICIDDGSKDSTGAIIDEYVAEDSRFKVIHKANSGYGDSMNRGLEVCTGDYVGIVESDDWIEPNMYEVLLSTAEKHDLDLVRCLWMEGPTGTESTDNLSWIKKNTVYRPLERKGVLLQQPAIWAALYRRDLLFDGRPVRFLPTPGASYQDTSFAFKTYCKSHRYMALDIPLHHYRVNPNSSVSSTGKVFCLNDEWEEMFAWICGDNELMKEFMNSDILAEVIYGGFVWNYQRLSPILRLWFLRRTSIFLRKAWKSGILFTPKFEKDPRGTELSQVISNPLSYHHKKTLQDVDLLFANNTCVEDSATHQDLVSVVVPCYNTSKYIQACLSSLIRQDYRNIEIICVDDCSTDETCTLVRHMIRKDNRICLVSTPSNSGLSFSRNLGLQNCHGKFVVFVDGDDYLFPGAISRMCAQMSESDDLVVGTISVDYEGGKDLYGWLPESDKHYYTNKSDARIHALDDIDKALGLHVSASAKLWRMDVIRKNGITFPVGYLFEDSNFYWKYLSVAPGVHTITTPVYLYRRHMTGSIMSNALTKKSGVAIQHLYVIEDLFTFLQTHVSESVCRKILENIYEPYFWFAYNNSPETDHDDVLSTMARILEEQDADTSRNPLLDYVRKFNMITKAQLFMQAFQGSKHRKRGLRKLFKFLR